MSAILPYSGNIDWNRICTCLCRNWVKINDGLDWAAFYHPCRVVSCKTLVSNLNNNRYKRKLCFPGSQQIEYRAGWIREEMLSQSASIDIWNRKCLGVNFINKSIFYIISFILFRHKHLREMVLWIETAIQRHSDRVCTWNWWINWIYTLTTRNRCNFDKWLHFIFVVEYLSHHYRTFGEKKNLQLFLE